MAKIEIIQYDPYHIDEIMKHPRQWEIKMSQQPDWPKWKNMWKNEGPAYTLLADGQIVGSAGVLIMENNIGEAWMVVSSMIEDYAKSVYVALKKRLDSIINEHKLKGVQAFVDPEFPQGKHLMKHLGFVEDRPIQVCGVDMIRFWRVC